MKETSHTIRKSNTDKLSEFCTVYWIFRFRTRAELLYIHIVYIYDVHAKTSNRPIKVKFWKLFNKMYYMYYVDLEGTIWFMFDSENPPFNEFITSSLNFVCILVSESARHLLGQFNIAHSCWKFAISWDLIAAIIFTQLKFGMRLIFDDKCTPLLISTLVY